MRIKINPLGFVGSIGAILTTIAAIVYFSQMTGNIGRNFLYILGTIVILCALPGLVPTQFLKRFEARLRARRQEWRSLLEAWLRNPVDAQMRDELQRLTLQMFPVFDRIAAGRSFTSVDQPVSTHIVVNEVEIDGAVCQLTWVEPRQSAVQGLDPRSSYFGIRVSGDSMIGLGIETGDIALVRLSNDLRDGQVAAVRIGDEATLKRVFPKLGCLLLKPENEAEPSIIVTADTQMESGLRQRYPEADGFKVLVEPDIEILGGVVAVFRPMR